ncbi:MAG: hypothetical protein LRY43_03100, partial [Gammaproteobacteria bacterium]|nr:hypothetical protein [Gammaproteobacteria bacterium]
MRKTGCRIIMLTVFSLLLSSCVQPTDNRYNKNVSAMNALLNENLQDKKRVQDSAKPLRLPTSVTDALMPSNTAFKDEKNSVESRFDIAVDHVSAEDFFTGLTQRSGLNVILAPWHFGPDFIAIETSNLTRSSGCCVSIIWFLLRKKMLRIHCYPRLL